MLQALRVRSERLHKADHWARRVLHLEHESDDHHSPPPATRAISLRARAHRGDRARASVAIPTRESTARSAFFRGACNPRQELHSRGYGYAFHCAGRGWVVRCAFLCKSRALKALRPWREVDLGGCARLVRTLCG